MCKDCLCNSCMQNAEDYADGMCRVCENCENEGINNTWTNCKNYESDNDPSGLIIHEVAALVKCEEVNREVRYCPACGSRIYAQDSEGKCHCTSCEYEFYVIDK